MARTKEVHIVFTVENGFTVIQEPVHRKAEAAKKHVEELTTPCPKCKTPPQYTEDAVDWTTRKLEN